MGFLKSLFGGNQPAIPRAPQREMEGKEYSLVNLMNQGTYLESIETQENIQSESARARFRWTPHKYQEFRKQFRGETIIFNGEVKSMLTTTFLVEVDLTGRLDALLYSQSLEEREDHERKWGEPPKFAGALCLEFREGKPCVD